MLKVNLLRNEVGVHVMSFRSVTFLGGFDRFLECEDYRADDDRIQKVFKYVAFDINVIKEQS